MPLVLLGLLLAVLVVCGPLALLWSLNTLFPSLVIPYTFWTWLAAFCLFGTAAGGHRK